MDGLVRREWRRLNGTATRSWRGQARSLPSRRASAPRRPCPCD